MTSRPSGGSLQRGFLGVLQTAALIALPAGAVGSVALTLYAGRHNPSRLLMFLFALWVLSPFAAMVLALAVSQRWPAIARTTLYGVMLVVTLCSLAIFGEVALGPPRPRTAFVFLVVPPVSCLLIGIVVLLRPRRKDGPAAGSG